MDLIHSFLLEEWEGIRKNYNPDKGEIESYVFVSFLHFARREIAKEKRRGLQLVDQQSIERYLETSAEPQGSTYDAEVLTRAVEQLSAIELQVLQRYLQTQSERQVARDTNLTRYRVRDALHRALGRIALFLRSSSAREDRWRITKEVLENGHTVRQGASKIGMPLDEAQELHTSNIRTLVRELEQTFATSESITHTIMSIADPTIDTLEEAVDLLQKALREGNEETFTALRENAEEIKQLLENGEILDDLDLEEADPRTLGRVYEELEKGLDFPDEDPREAEARRQYAQALSSEEAAIGEAFGTLLADLDDEFAGQVLSLDNPSQWIKGVAEKVPKGTRAVLDNRNDVKSAPKSIRSLTAYGITPVKLVRAIKAVPNLIDSMVGSAEPIRIEVYTDDDKSGHVQVHSEGLSDEKVAEIEKYLVPEIASFSDVSRPVAFHLLRWMVGIAMRKSYVFPRYEAVPRGEGVILRREETPSEDLASRWSQIEDIRATAAAGS
jgi:hypothetical protein